MPDLNTAVTVAGFPVGISGLWMTWLMLKRTPKLPEPPIVPVSTLILGASVTNNDNLPTYSPGMSRMGFGRFDKKS